MAVMNVPLVLAGLLFIAWPFFYRWNLGRMEERAAARGDDSERIREVMNRPWLWVSLIGFAVIGVACVVLGLIS
jgi:hypothetical protein